MGRGDEVSSWPALVILRYTCATLMDTTVFALVSLSSPMISSTRFWAKTLVRRSALEFGEGVYEIGGGIKAAEAAGVSK